MVKMAEVISLKKNPAALNKKIKMIESKRKSKEEKMEKLQEQAQKLEDEVYDLEDEMADLKEIDLDRLEVINEIPILVTGSRDYLAVKVVGDDVPAKHNKQLNIRPVRGGGASLSKSVQVDIYTKNGRQVHYVGSNNEAIQAAVNYILKGRWVVKKDVPVIPESFQSF